MAGRSKQAAFGAQAHKGQQVQSLGKHVARGRTTCHDVCTTLAACGPSALQVNVVLNKIDLVRDMNVDVEDFVSQMKVRCSTESDVRVQVVDKTAPCCRGSKELLLRDLGVDKHGEAIFLTVM